MREPNNEFCTEAICIGGEKVSGKILRGHKIV